MKLILPDPTIRGKYSHAQDTFRELGQLWSNFLKIEYSIVKLLLFIKGASKLYILSSLKISFVSKIGLTL